MKKKAILLSFILFWVGSSAVLAASYSYYGTTSESSAYLWANTTTGLDAFTQISYESCGSATIKYYQTIDNTATFKSQSSLSNGAGSINPPANTNAIKLVSNDGNEVYITSVTTNRTSGTFSNDGSCGDGGSDNGSDSGSGDSNCGCIFNTPGWNDYMGKVDQIINKIPSPPNWGKVAEKFRDTIVPKMIDDMSDMLGRAPTPPRAPSLPPGPSKPDMPKNPGLKEPTGKDGIGNGGFTSDDIKNDAPVIEEREDPTGGFDILDPVGQLPSQDEFKDHVPDEGDMIPPEVPDVDAEAPTPPEKDNKAPKPPEQENKAPSPPKDPVNHAPDPGDVSGTAPTPPKQDNPAPGAPKDPDNHAPNPGDIGATAPIPGGIGGTAPMPGEDTGSAPIPGNYSGTGPIPDKDNSTAPIPGGD